MRAVTFAIVGAGFRAQYFLRLAALLPERFQVTAMVVRDPRRAEEMRAAWAIPTHGSLSALVADHRPDFILLSTTRTAAPSLLTEAAAANVAVVTETPPAADLQGLLDIWRLVTDGARIQVAEQYLYHPWHAARLALVRSGRLGEISQVQVSVANDYHGVSLMRLLLGVGFAPARISAREFKASIVAGPSREGPPQEERWTTPRQLIAQLDFGSKLGIYDFIAGQARSWLRAPRLLVRGERGEIKDSEVRFLKDFRTPITLELRRFDTGQQAGPEEYAHKGILAGDTWLYASPFPEASLSDDEIAGATFLQKMADYLEGGPEPYPFAQAAQDQYLALAMEEAVATGHVITADAQPWADAPAWQPSEATALIGT
jgi:predicted dehydrogenase